MRWDFMVSLSVEEAGFLCDSIDSILQDAQMAENRNAKIEIEFADDGIHVIQLMA